MLRKYLYKALFEKIIAQRPDADAVFVYVARELDTIVEIGAIFHVLSFQRGTYVIRITEIAYGGLGNPVKITVITGHDS